MAGLIDIAAVSETVEIRGVQVTVTGVSAEAIAQLLWRFPELRKMYETKTLDVDGLLAMSSDVVAAILAAGTGAAGNAQAEAKAKTLVAGEQAELMGAILRITMPRGPGPFVKALNQLTGAVGDPSEKAPATRSRKRSSSSPAAAKAAPS